MGLRLKIAGSSPSIFQLGRSFAQTVEVESAGFTYDSVAMNVGGFGENVDFDIGSFLEGLFVANLNDSTIPLINDALQGVFDNGLPFN